MPSRKIAFRIRPSPVSDFAQDRRPRPGCDRGDTGWPDQGDRRLLQRSSQVSSKMRAIESRLIVRILKHCRNAIDLGRMRARLWLKYSWRPTTVVGFTHGRSRIQRGMVTRGCPEASLGGLRGWIGSKIAPASRMAREPSTSQGRFRPIGARSTRTRKPRRRRGHRFRGWSTRVRVGGMRVFKNRSDDVMNRAWTRRRRSKSDRLVDTYGAMPRASFGVSSFLIRSSGRGGLAFAPSSGPSKKPLGPLGRHNRSSNDFQAAKPQRLRQCSFR